ncbi:PREDICTED: calcium-transporting ATPase 12, plasma membrane-type [Tarenaya hassleriana]|uniref:calcium-transporting ATPase 12, plasma membrane-type n=1 Tax=Tarenaya hassleriana TaxID=28532 RepID=UPI00053C1374|nr:PREDICTED: calcium-transporting ATPase 12, plasma membrane-type [Tarenaya hassleriana]XP_010545105.1 PREDICTED: calcium-transporting ATPase 12, plasma membrane-type [Tarenaya hassleriana]
MRDLKGSDYSALVLKLTSSGLTKAQRRWRIAYTAIYSIRAMLSLLREIVPQKSPDVSLSAPYADSAMINSIPEIEQDLLFQIMKEKDLRGVTTLGGVEGVAAALRTNPTTGIHGNEQELSRRQELFGSNTYHRPPPKGLLFFVSEAFKDTTILILLACAILSLGFGIKEHGIKEGWYEGGSISIAVFLVISVSALSNFRQERQFDKLSNISNNIKVEVLRDGRRQLISIFDVVVGDVVFLKIGDQIPADGLFLDGHSLHVDESSMTGESDHVEVDHKENPFLLSGTKVVDGFAQMLVLSVGMNTTWGQTMSSINQDLNDSTPLQVRLDTLTSTIGKVGLMVAALVLVVLLVRYFTGNTEGKDGKREYNGSKTSVDHVFNAVVRIIAAAVTIVVVAIPEGLPLAVTLTLAYSMKRMMSDQAMVRKLSACETMGSATVICTDKTGTLTLNEMKVTKFWVGQESIHEDSCNMISSDVLELFYQGVGLNTTGSVCVSDSGSTPEFSGSPTEKALISWAVLKLGMDMESVKQTHHVLQVETFNSTKKRSGVLLRRKSDNTVHVHWKGAAEMILAMCSSYYKANGSVDSMDSNTKNRFETIIQGMAASSLRCIAFAHKVTSEDSGIEEEGLSLMGIVGLKDPCRPGVAKAVEACKLAGVNIKMITGDNVFTAKAIAMECGILEHGDQDDDKEVVVDGVQFRNYNDEERIQKVDKIRVMARSSPSDKLLMVKCLRQKGHVVAVTGDGTNDAPALKEADIGLSMGIQGTEVAKESSDIVILDDNFASVATVLKWGRCVYNNIQKFIQFQLTVNVAALVINFIAAVSAGEVPLTTVQLLWVNLIMDTLGALALATERPTNELLKQKPVGRTEPLITNIMWRNLLAQSLYQITILLIFQFKGRSIFNVSKEVKDTLIFNTFVLSQVFNEFNSREMEKRNVFKGIHRNKLFIGIIAITILLQVIMVEFLKKFADTVRLTGWQWGVCIGLAALSWPIGFFMKFIPVSKTPFLSYLKSPTSLFKSSEGSSLLDKPLRHR